MTQINFQNILKEMQAQTTSLNLNNAKLASLTTNVHNLQGENKNTSVKVGTLNTIVEILATVVVTNNTTNDKLSITANRLDSLSKSVNDIKTCDYLKIYDMESDQHKTESTSQDRISTRGNVGQYVQQHEVIPIHNRSRIPITHHERLEPEVNIGRNTMIEDITRKVKIYVKSYDGTLDPKILLDWLSFIDDYFEWYNMRDERRIRLANMKLEGSARRYWTQVIQDRERRGLKPIYM